MSVRRHRTRSIITRLVVFLLLGAVVNVAVAWGFAIRPEPYGTIYLRLPSAENDRTTLIYRLPGEMRIVQHNGILSGYWIEPPIHLREAEYRQIVPFWSEFRDAEPVTSIQYNPALPKFSTYSENSFGWPCFSLRYVEVSHSPLQGVKGFAEESDALKLPSAIGDWLPRDHWGHQLPLHPLPGFAINTLFYAAILWLFFVAPGRVRRWRRIRRELCATCAYPVGASDVCTECGAAISSGRRPARK